MYKTIAFDIDGTLLNTETALFLALQKTIRDAQGREVNYEDVSFFFGLAGAVTMKRLGFEDVDNAVQTWIDNVAQFRSAICLYDGITSTLETLRDAEIRMGVVTSRLIAEMEPDFTNFDLNRFFDCRICIEDTVNHKPHREPMEKFLERMNAAPSDTIYVADTIYDMQCAIGAGVDFAYATWGVKEPDPKVIERSNIVLRKPEEIISLIH